MSDSKMKTNANANETIKEVIGDEENDNYGSLLAAQEVFQSPEFDEFNDVVERLEMGEQQVNDMLTKELEEEINALQQQCRTLQKDKLDKEEKRKLDLDNIQLKSDYEIKNT